jgi:hypothetical protein
VRARLVLGSLLRRRSQAEVLRPAPLPIGYRVELASAVRQGARFLRAELPIIVASRTDVLSPRMLRVIEDLAGDAGARLLRSNGLSRPRTANGMVRPCSCPASEPGRTWGCIKWSTPCPRQQAP